MQGPIRSPAPNHILPARNLASVTIPANRVVALSAQDSGLPTLETPITTLYSAPSGHKNAYGITQTALRAGLIGDIYREGELTLESDGTSALAIDDLLIAVVGASDAVSGKVTKIPDTLVAGTRYQVVGKCLAPVAATPGLLVRVQVQIYTVVGAAA